MTKLPPQTPSIKVKPHCSKCGITAHFGDVNRLECNQTDCPTFDDSVEIEEADEALSPLDFEDGHSPESGSTEPTDDEESNETPPGTTGPSDFLIGWIRAKNFYEKDPANIDALCHWLGYKVTKHLVDKFKVPLLCFTCLADPRADIWEISMDLPTEGYIAAKRAVSKYDSKRDRGNGLEAFLYKCAETGIRNASWKQFSDWGGRGNNLPIAVRSDGTFGEAEDGVLSGWDEAHQIQITPSSSEKAPAHVYNKEVPYRPGRPRTPLTPIELHANERSNFADLESAVMAQLDAELLLGTLDANDRLVLERYFGIGNYPAMTYAKLAKISGCSTATVERKVKKLLAELRVIANDGS